jgi:hypothetical protein
MNRILKLTLIPVLLTANLVGISLITASSAKADNKILGDMGIGAAAGVVSGVINHDTLINHAIKGAASGAAVNAANGLRSARNRKKRNTLQDVGVGAAAGAVTGRLIHGGGNTFGDAVDGFAAGTAIHFLRNGK